ncbi:MAG TPA: type II toxin-antitoxin system VapC family toxin [Pirellulaceae bacterium]|jgi:predicted nucleic acid-binding protein
MSAVLLNTDVFSFVFKRDTRAKLYERELIGAHACLSFQSVAELQYWANARQWGEARRHSLELTFRRYIVLPYDDAMSQYWADITASRRSHGKPIACGDAWIAATALRHGLPLLTHNANDYADIPGLQVVCRAV